MAEDNLENRGAADGAGSGGQAGSPWVQNDQDGETNELRQKDGEVHEADAPSSRGGTSGAMRNNAASRSDADGASADSHSDSRAGIHDAAPVSEEQAARGVGATPPARGRLTGKAQAGAATGIDAGGDLDLKANGTS